MTFRRTVTPITVFAVIVASVLITRAGAAVTSHRHDRPADGRVAATLVRYAAGVGIDSLVIRGDATDAGRRVVATARAAAARYGVNVEPDGLQAGTRDGLLLLSRSADDAQAYCAIEHPGRGVFLPPWLDDAAVFHTSELQVFVATRRGNGLQLWTPANIAFLPPSLSQGHDHADGHGGTRLALVQSWLPLDG